MSQNHQVSDLLFKCKQIFLHLYCSGAQRVPINPQHVRVICTRETSQPRQHFCSEAKAESRRRLQHTCKGIPCMSGRGANNCFGGFVFCTKPETHEDACPQMSQDDSSGRTAWPSPGLVLLFGRERCPAARYSAALSFASRN